MHNEINTLEVRIKKIKKQIELPSTENEIKGQMTEFLQVRYTYLYLVCQTIAWNVYHYVLRLLIRKWVII